MYSQASWLEVTFTGTARASKPTQSPILPVGTVAFCSAANTCQWGSTGAVSRAKGLGVGVGVGEEVDLGPWETGQAMKPEAPWPW